MPQPAIVNVTGSPFTLTGSNSGQILILGPPTTPQHTGAWMIQLVPQDVGFTCALAVLGRIAGKDAHDGSVAFQPVPYRRIMLDNVGQDYAITTDALSTSFLIQVPANQLSIALFGTISGGTAVLYTKEAQTAASP